MGATSWRFYVYLLESCGIPIYIGKGSGSRLSCQQSNHKCLGYELARFKTEKSAYAFERQAIAEYQPLRNRHPGGAGGSAKKAGRQPREYLSKATREQDKEIDRLGSRVYVARFLMSLDLRGRLDASKLEQIREVAYGCRL